jgi:uncharacterized membrane protein
MPAALTTFLLAMLPVTELRAALPLGIKFGLSPLEAFFWATAGNVLMAVALIFLFEPVAVFLQQHSRVFKKIIQKVFQKTRHRHSKNFNRFGALFLVLLVAIPLPGSGGYTGALAAWLFGVSRKSTIGLVSLGLILSGLIVLGITTGAIALVGFW